MATLRACATLGRPVFVVEAGRTRGSELASWIVRVLNVAGKREFTDPGIGARVEAFLVATFRRLDVPLIRDFTPTTRPTAARGPAVVRHNILK